MNAFHALFLLQACTCWSLPIISKEDRKERALKDNVDTALIDTINSMSAIKTIMVCKIIINKIIINYLIKIVIASLQEGLLPYHEINDVIDTISELLKLKATIGGIKNSISDRQVVNELLDVALNQSCTWVSVYSLL